MKTKIDKKWKNVKLTSTDIKDWLIFIECIGVQSYEVFSNPNLPLYVSKGTKGLAVFESGLCKGEYLLTTFSEESWIDINGVEWEKEV